MEAWTDFFVAIGALVLALVVSIASLAPQPRVATGLFRWPCSTPGCC